MTELLQVIRDQSKGQEVQDGRSYDSYCEQSVKPFLEPRCQSLLTETDWKPSVLLVRI